MLCLLILDVFCKQISFIFTTFGKKKISNFRGKHVLVKTMVHNYDIRYKILLPLNLFDFLLLI